MEEVIARKVSKHKSNTCLTVMPIDSSSQHLLLNDYHMKQEQKSKMQ